MKNVKHPLVLIVLILISMIIFTWLNPNEEKIRYECENYTSPEVPEYCPEVYHRANRIIKD